MELWEFNLFILGRSNAYKQKMKDMITLAYYTASFNNTEKAKPLSFYLSKIDEEETTSKEQKEKILYAKKMSERIERRNKCTK